MKTGTIQVRYKNRIYKGAGKEYWSRLVRESQKENPTAPLRLSTSEIRATARNLRELLLWDLREEGYTFREIGELFGMSRQRASQLERKMVRRASGAKLKKRPQSLRPLPMAISNAPKMWIRTITKEDFEGRLARINRLYQEQFIRVVQRNYNRKHPSELRAQASSEFWRVWPLIETYQKQPFSYSRLTADFPQLAGERHLAQFLNRLRRTGLLRKVGTLKVAGHNLPEVLMAEAPVELHVNGAIERLVERWSDQLLRLQATHRPNRPSRSIEFIRQYLIDRLIGEGISRSETEQVFGSRGVGTDRCKVPELGETSTSR